MKKKILIVTECFYPEEFKINDLAFAWRDKGYDVSVLTQVPSYPLGIVYDGYVNKFFSKEVYEGITIYRVHATTGYKESLIKKLFKYFSFMFFGSIVGVVIGRRFDYIFGFNMSALTNMVPGVVIKKIFKKPLTFWAQDIWPDSVYAYGFNKTRLLSFFLNKFVKFMYHNVTSIAISGKGFETKLRPYAKNNLLFHYLPNWADDLNMSLDAYEFSKEDKVQFTFAGNIGKVQNLENIIEAFSLLPAQYQQISQLNIIGDGSNRQALQAMCDDNSNIIFHGKKLREEMARYYKASDFLIISLIDEPIFEVTVPAKLQTYILAKKPILAVINGDVADIVKDNNLGYCTKPNDIDKIRDGFIECINTDEKSILEFTKNCEFLTNSTFDKKKIMNALEKLLVGDSK